MRIRFSKAPAVVSRRKIADVGSPRASKLESSRVAAEKYLNLQAVFLASSVAYAILVAFLWSPYNLHSGFPYETGFPYLSETSSALGGFLFPNDLLRIYTNTFYHLSYLLSELAGVRGSYVPYQVVYALLWWARAVLVFLILRRFLPRASLICYAAGALVLVHASDGALQWVGQMNQFGFIFWMLAAFYCLIRAYDSLHPKAAKIWAVAACFFEHMSLWSHESQLLLLLVFPFALLFRRRQYLKLKTLAAAWYSMPGVYLALTLLRYAVSAGTTYQESVLRKGWSVGSLLSDWIFNITASLEFWNWMRVESKASERLTLLLSISAALVFVAFGLIVIRYARSLGDADLISGARTCWILLGAGTLLLILSFPAYLLLDSARSMWRTQFLSGIGSAITMTALLGLAASLFSRQSIRISVLLFPAALVVVFGGISAIQKSAVHRSIWDRHREAMLKIMQVVPHVRPNTMIVLTNVPKNGDPFMHQMWLDLAFRLIYPGVPVEAIYYYSDGSRGPGTNFQADGDSWKWDQTGLIPLVRQISLAQSIVVDYNSGGTPKLIEIFPSFLCKAICAVEIYHPAAVIDGALSQIAARRYRLH